MNGADFHRAVLALSCEAMDANVDLGDIARTLISALGAVSVMNGIDPRDAGHVLEVEMRHAYALKAAAVQRGEG